MATVRFTSALQRFYPDLDSFSTELTSIIELLDFLEEKWPGIKDYLVDERNRLRKHVNIFIDGTLIVDRDLLSDPIPSEGEVFFFQALSGG